MGECIHAFTVRVPRFVTPDVTDRTCPLPLAYVYATRDSLDPRLCGMPVPAAVKWISDALDGIEPVSATALTGCPLKANAEVIEPTIITAMRATDGHAASDSVNWATCSFSHHNESRNEVHRLNADLWGTNEVDALKHVLHSLTSLGLAYNLAFESAVLHGAVQNDEGVVQVVAIRGDTHQDCRLHYDKHIPHHGTDPVLVIAHDHDNLVPTPEEYSRIYETQTDSGLVFLDYQTLIDKCRNAADSNMLKGYLDGILPRQRRII